MKTTHQTEPDILTDEFLRVDRTIKDVTEDGRIFLATKTLRDPTLSLEARGMLVYLLGYDTEHLHDFTSVINEALGCVGTSKTKLRQWFTELEARNFLVRQQLECDDRKFHRVCTVSDLPIVTEAIE